jgi:hypothetical protein
MQPQSRSVLDALQSLQRSRDLAKPQPRLSRRSSVARMVEATCEVYANVFEADFDEGRDERRRIQVEISCDEQHKIIVCEPSSEIREIAAFVGLNPVRQLSTSLSRRTNRQARKPDLQVRRAAPLIITIQLAPPGR